MLGKISSHHIGGRNGARAFPILKAFEKDLISVLYEADKDCIEDIKEKIPGSGSKLYVLPYCVGGVNGKAEFNLNRDPYTSSLLKSNGSSYQHYSFLGGLDCVWGEQSKTLKSFDIEIRMLDSILIDRKDLPNPDFLSIDTQGSEYDILLGAKELLKEHILGLVVEVEFKELYKDQHLFGDVGNLLLSHGFEFIKFIDISESSPYRAPVGLRAEGQQICADALFLKRDDTVGSRTAEDYVKLRKLAFLSIAFNQLERGLLYMSKSRGISLSQEMQSQLLKSSCFRFLDELDREISLIKKRYPVTFADMYSLEKSESRKMINVIKKNDTLYKTLRTIRDMLRNSVSRLNYIVRIYLSPNTSIEDLLCRYGLRGLAKKVKLNRIYQLTHAKFKKR
jgi:FkbM family methyltransferase